MCFGQKAQFSVWEVGKLRNIASRSRIMMEFTWNKMCNKQSGSNEFGKIAKLVSPTLGFNQVGFKNIGNSGRF